MQPKYRIHHEGNGIYTLRHPDGYWIGPGLGEFLSPAAAMDYLIRHLRQFPWTYTG